MRLLILTAILFISSCASMETNVAQVKPETLLTSNVEDVSFAINSSEALDSMFEWVLDDRPTNAQLLCANGDSLCVGAERILNKFSVPYRMNVVESDESTVSLVYSRLMKKECRQGIGCAMSANFISSITDQTDFTNPSLSDYQDAQKAVENIKTYYTR
jgi:hypothetical protein